MILWFGIVEIYSLFNLLLGDLIFEKTLSSDIKKSYFYRWNILNEHSM
tara:strand:+ start:178 stop:321 length:144 start_codon:yes stop_codon:yes gene_type:complete